MTYLAAILGLGAACAVWVLFLEWMRREGTAPPLGCGEQRACSGCDDPTPGRGGCPGPSEP